MNNFLRKVGSKCFSLFFPRLTDLERRLQKVYDVKEQVTIQPKIMPLR